MSGVKKRSPSPPIQETPEPKQELTPEGNPVTFPEIGPPCQMMPKSMPMQVKMLADHFVSDPKKGILAHARAVGMSLADARISISREDVRQYIGDALDNAGATVEASCRAIGDALSAEKLVQTKDGNLNLPDHEYRLRAAALALKLRGLLQQNEKGEQPLTLAALIVAVQQERQRRALEIQP